METTKSLRISSLENDMVFCHIVAVPVASVEGGNKSEVVGRSGIGSGRGIASQVEAELERDNDVNEGEE